MSDDRGTLAGTLMIASGVFTVLTSASLFFGLVWVCVGVAWLPALAIGVAEIVVGAAIIGRPPASSVRTVSVLGILAALMCGNLIGVGLEIAAMVVANRPAPRLLGG